MQSCPSGALLFTILLAWPGAHLDAAGQQRPETFRSGVELVEVPVLVRDRDGRLVRDLTQNDFQVIEDDVPQTLEFFERVSIPVVAPAAARAEPVAMPRDVSTNDVPADSRLFVLLLDSLHVTPQRAVLVKKYARQFIDDHVGPSDLVAVVSPGALPSATQDFTTDKGRLLAAVEQFSGNKLKSAATEIEEERRMAGATGIMMHEGRDPSDPERANRVQSLASTLGALATHLSRVERRRKALLLFTEGIDYNVGDTGGFTQGKQRYVADVVEAMERGIAAVVRASVVIYTIDPRGLASAEGDALQLPIHGERPSGDLSAPTRYAEFTNSIQSLRHFAEATGGFAAIDRNDFTGAFERIIHETSDYYVVGYVPAKPARPGEVRRISVRVSRPGAAVVARKVYSGAPRDRRPQAATAYADVPTIPGPPPRGARPRSIEAFPDPASAAPPTRGLPSRLETLLASPLPRPGLPLRLQAIPFRGEGRNHAVTLVIEVSGKALAFLERDGRFHERIELALLSVDGRARADNGTSTTLDLRLTQEERDRVKATGVRWLSRLSLAPGRYQIRVAAHAERTNASGLATVDVDVPRFEPDRTSLSGVALTSRPAALAITRGEGRVPAKLPTPPATSRTFVPGDRVTAVVEVYAPAGGAEVTVSARVERLDAGGTDDQPLRAERRAAPGTAREGREELAFAFETSTLPPGSYVLRISAGQTGSSERTDRTVPFTIVPPLR